LRLPVMAERVEGSSGGGGGGKQRQGWRVSASGQGPVEPRRRQGLTEAPPGRSGHQGRPVGCGVGYGVGGGVEQWVQA
jgi:hypothetical protein